MKRGDVVTIALKGHYSGKPRPAIIIQSDLFAETGGVVVCLLSSALIEAPLLRIDVEPSPKNGLRVKSQIMIDKIVTIPHHKIGDCIGTIEDITMIRVDRCLTVFLGIAKAPKRRTIKRKN